MSIETHVFTPMSQPIAILELIEDMAAVNLIVRVIRNFRNWKKFDVVDAGEFQNAELLCGWPTTGLFESEIERAVADRDGQGIEEFLREGNLGTCGVGIRNLETELPEDRVELAELDGDDAFAAAMAASITDDCAFSSAGRNDLSILLQFRLTQIIARQGGGVWTDPVSDDYLIVESGCWERLPCLVAYEEEDL